MATTSHARAVNSLNAGPTRWRFVFKSFSLRLDNVEIDVYRSLDRIKPDDFRRLFLLLRLPLRVVRAQHRRGFHLLLRADTPSCSEPPLNPVAYGRHRSPASSALVRLLKDGGDRKPEVLEPIFYSWSCIVMHLQKYLTRRVASVFKVTLKLRYYPKG
ncbi:hypothetical protein MLD38_022615 [Melastoma candidum]|uniref:Uncharacterized protein n=1 Tax=Melastoma candidum TaxID=119954 RepID=A0ACB9QL22_9MYRT|nr:hypothetical protein MLD38_022615 [Melastoma candidum]